jgi:hypothetical protein
MRMTNSLRPLLFLLAASLLSLPAPAQVVFTTGNTTVTTEAFANLTAGADLEDERADADDLEGVLDGELRVLAQWKVSDRLTLGPRVTVRAAAGSASGDDLDFGEESLLIRGSWGRFEFGERRGLPDVLTGYAPNNFQFVSAEFGPASGRSLDPDGGLQSALLGETLGGQIGSLASLGITASFFFDESAKVIYVSPKRRGFLGGVSFSPDARDAGGRYGELVQVGLTHETYKEKLIYKFGGTYAFADGAGTAATGGNKDLHSFSFGGVATFNDSLTVGASFTWNPAAGIAQNGVHDADSLGYAASINYNSGVWTFGAFFQSARGEGDALLRGEDSLDAFEFGVSRRLSTRVRFYGAAYFYDFEDEGSSGADDGDGTLLIFGVRVAL